jgi:hypothetical protein
MDFSKKIIIVIIILIFTYILIRLFQKRSILQQNYDKIEGFDFTDANVTSIQENNLSSITIQDNLNSRLANISSKFSSSLQLYNFTIKASMNTAYDGNTCNIDMISYVLSRGCRYLDFEVFRNPDENNSNTIVSVSTSSSDFTIPITQEIPLSITDAINHTSTYSFNNICPNWNDPLFIQIRPRAPSTDTDNKYLKSILKDIYEACNAYLINSDRLYPNKVTPNTSMTELTEKPKVVLILDNTVYANISTLSTDLSRIVNMYTNQSTPNGIMNTIKYSKLPIKNPLKISSNGFNAMVKNTITQSLWIDDKNLEYNTNSDSYLLFKDYSCQIIPMIFWDNGTDLYNYEMLFNNCGGGIIPISLVYSKLNINSKPYMAYPDPIFAMPNYGSKTSSVLIIITCLGIAGYIFYNDSKRTITT